MQLTGVVCGDFAKSFEIPLYTLRESLFVFEQNSEFATSRLLRSSSKIILLDYFMIHQSDMSRPRSVWL